MLGDPPPDNIASTKTQFYFEDALQKAKKLSPGSQTDTFLRKIALAEASVGNIPAAFLIAGSGMDDYGKDEVYAEIAKFQSQGGNIDGALRTAKSIKSAYDRDRATAATVKAQCKADGIAAAERTVQQLQGDSAKAEGLVEIANAQAQSRDIGAAVHTVAEIRKLDNWPYNTACLAVSEIAKTEVLAGDVTAGLRRARHVPDFYRKEAALEECGVALADAGKVSVAVRFLDAIKDVKARRGKAGDKEDALSYAAQRRQRTDSEVNVLRAIAVAEMRAGKLAGALARAGRIMRIEKEASDLPGIVQALAQTGNLAAAKRLSDLIKSMTWKDLAMCYIAKEQAKAGDIPGAFVTAQQIQNPEWKSDTIGDVVQALAQSGDIAGALRLAGSMNKDIYQASAIGAVAARQVLAGHDVEAEKTLSLLELGAPSVEGDLTVAQILLSRN